MPLGFLVPLFLAGLAALAIPVAVHLRHRERREPVRFPSLMFLRRIPFREARRQQIHHWPLFLLRLLAVALLALAFARPLVTRAGGTPAGSDTRRREVVLLLDRSASMAAGDRWTRAVDSARAALAGLDDGDRVSLVLFDTEPVVAAGPTTDRGLVRAALEAAAPGSRATRYAVALRSAHDLLAGSERRHRTLVVITDFQRAGWRGEVIEPLPAGTLVRLVSVAHDAPANGGLATVEIAEAGSETRPAVVVAVRATGDTTAGSRVTLTLDGRATGVQPAVVGRGGVASIGPVSVPEGMVRGVAVRSPADGLAADDTLRFVAAPPRPVRILVVDAGDGGSAFLERALAISVSPRVALTRRAGPFRPVDLDAADAVFLHGTPAPGGATGERLRRFLEDGGGVVWVLGAQAIRLPEWAGLQAGAVVEPASGRIGAVRRDHPVFEPFARAGTGDFGTARYLRYRAVTGDSLDVVARFTDGAPALVERAIGRGRLLVLTSALDNTWGDLPIQPVFLPLVHQLALYAARYVERPAGHHVGQVAVVSPDRLAGQEAVVVVSPSGARDRREIGGEPLAVALQEAGFYEVREARPGGRLLDLVAANLDPEEARLEAFDPEDLGVAAGAVDSATAAAALAEVLGPREQEARQGLWWYLLAGLALLLAAEALAGGRAPGYVRTMTPEGNVR